MSENKLCDVPKVFTKFCNPTPRACGRGGATSGAEHIHWSVRVGARRTLSEQSARPRHQLNCGTLARGSSRLNSMNRSTAHKIHKRFMFLSVLLYRRVLASDRNILAPMCAGNLLTGKSGVQHWWTGVGSCLRTSFLFHSVPFVPALPHISRHLTWVAYLHFHTFHAIWREWLWRALWFPILVSQYKTSNLWGTMFYSVNKAQHITTALWNC
jgi:hypothetical protein